MVISCIFITIVICVVALYLLYFLIITPLKRRPANEARKTLVYNLADEIQKTKTSTGIYPAKIVNQNNLINFYNNNDQKIGNYLVKEMQVDSIEGKPLPPEEATIKFTDLTVMEGSRDDCSNIGQTKEMNDNVLVICYDPLRLELNTLLRDIYSNTGFVVTRSISQV